MSLATRESGRKPCGRGFPPRLGSPTLALSFPSPPIWRMERGLPMSRRIHYSRRDFLRASAATAGVASLAPRAYARILGANERIHFAVIGLGVMGSGHLQGLK